eukprot:2861839-Pyramimonas_sp.AAC.1
MLPTSSGNNSLIFRIFPRGRAAPRSGLGGSCVPGAVLHQSAGHVSRGGPSKIQVALPAASRRIHVATAP